MAFDDVSIRFLVGEEQTNDKYVKLYCITLKRPIGNLSMYDWKAEAFSSLCFCSFVFR